MKITATAHKLARLFYLMWTNGAEYVDLGLDYYEHKYQEQILNNLKKKAQSLGFDLVSQTPALAALRKVFLERKNVIHWITFV